jgi:L-ribulose-5-phosphate 3-epimerase
MVISFMSANFVARETGWAMHGWGHGDRATNEAFAPLETYEERLDELLREIRALGYDAVDVWGAHLNPEWATDDHVAVARESLGRHGLRVSTYAAWLGPGNAARAAEIALALGTSLIGAGASGDVRALLETRGVRLAYENHPERTPAELPADVGVTVDTGWWATQGYDPVRAIEELGNRVLHVHLKDVKARGEPHETCRWGEGIVDVERCVRALERIGYDSAISVEHEPEDHDPSEECRAMRVQLEEWLS